MVQFWQLTRNPPSPNKQEMNLNMKSKKCKIEKKKKKKETVNRIKCKLLIQCIDTLY